MEDSNVTVSFAELKVLEDDGKRSVAPEEVTYSMIRDMMEDFLEELSQDSSAPSPPMIPKPPPPETSRKTSQMNRRLFKGVQAQRGASSAALSSPGGASKSAASDNARKMSQTQRPGLPPSPPKRRPQNVHVPSTVRPAGRMIPDRRSIRGSHYKVLPDINPKKGSKVSEGTARGRLGVEKALQQPVPVVQIGNIKRVFLTEVAGLPASPTKKPKDKLKPEPPKTKKKPKRRKQREPWVDPKPVPREGPPRVYWADRERVRPLFARLMKQEEERNSETLSDQVADTEQELAAEEENNVLPHGKQTEKNC